VDVKDDDNDYNIDSIDYTHDDDDDDVADKITHPKDNQHTLSLPKQDNQTKRLFVLLFSYTLFASISAVVGLVVEGLCSNGSSKR
jgi:hypothetical protein